MVSPSQSLCLTCGLCCAGPIFPSVQLEPEDEIAPLMAAGIAIYSENDANMFKQPCPAHKNCSCTVYENRPKNCRSYKCELLKRFERGDMSREAAAEIISKVVSFWNKVNALALAVSINIQSTEDMFLLLKKWRKNSSVGSTEQARAHVFVQFGALQIYLDRFFRRKPFSQAGAPHIN